MFINDTFIKATIVEKSHKHHYLPVFYLKGFTNQENQFFVFDKLYESIKIKYPTNSFFEIDRNTATIGDKRSSLLEEIYQNLENASAPHFEKLKSVTDLAI